MVYRTRPFHQPKARNRPTLYRPTYPIRNQKYERYQRRRIQQEWGYNTRQQIRLKGLTNRAIAIYNRNRPYVSIPRYEQIWSQRTVQRTVPRFSPPNVQTGPTLGPLSQGALPPSGTPFGNIPKLPYEQQNKDWTQYNPFHRPLYPPSQKQALQTATTRAEHQIFDYLRTMLPLTRYAPFIGDLRFLNTQLPRERWKQLPWLWRKLLPGVPKIPDIPPEQPTQEPPAQKDINPVRPCYHWDARLQRTVPCSQTLFQKKTYARSKGPTPLSQRTHYSRHYRRRYNSRRNYPYYPRNYRRGSRSYQSIKRYRYRRMRIRRSSYAYRSYT